MGPLLVNHALWVVGVAVLIFVVLPFVFFVPKPKFGGFHMSLTQHMKDSRSKPSTSTTYATGPAKVVKLTSDHDPLPGRIRLVMYKGEVIAATFGGSENGLPFVVEKINDKERFQWWQRFYSAGRQGSIRRIDHVRAED